MTIGEMAAATGLTTHTLRYYEDEGLIPRVERNPAGHRRYRPEHARWVALLERLRTSGMSMARMRRYVELALEGDTTIQERRALLATHERDIVARIEELRHCRAIVRAKLDLYDGCGDMERVWRLVEEAVEGRGDEEAGARGLRRARSGSSGT